MERKVPNCSQRKPHFFKVLLGDFHQCLRIPPSFVKHISKEASSSTTAATLEGPNGSIWHVELSKRRNGIFLQDGWQKFAQAHFLKESDFLVFKYTGPMHFSVRVFEKTGCEREECFDSKVCVEPTFAERKRQGQAREESPNCGTVVQDKAWKSNDTSAAKHSVGGTHMLSRKQEGTIETEEEDLDLPVDEHGLNAGSLCNSTRGQWSEKSVEKAKLQERVDSFTSKFPFSTKQIGLNKSYTTFPASFSRQHLPRKKTNISLRDPKGKEWQVTLIWSGPRDRCFICGGWNAFLRGNNIKEGDICIFELVDKLVMHVHIFHSVNETSQPSS